MQVIPKWDIKIEDGLKIIQFSISEYHYSNVLSLLAKLDFGPINQIKISKMVTSDLNQINQANQANLNTPLEGYRK